MNTLFIDTRDNKKIIVRFEKDRKIYKKEAVRSPDKAQVALPLIEKIIKNSKASLRDIDEIKVEKGPGSFTGLRVGISIANALSFALGKKVNGKKLGSIEQPQY